MTYALPADVATELEVESFSSVRLARVTALIANAALLIDRVPGVAARIVSGDLDAGLVKLVVVRMVARMLGAPGAVKSETIGPKSVVYRDVASGLYLDDADLALLAPIDAEDNPVPAGSVQMARPVWWTR